MIPWKSCSNKSTFFTYSLSRTSCIALTTEDILFSLLFFFNTFFSFAKAFQPLQDKIQFTYISFHNLQPLNKGIVLNDIDKYCQLCTDFFRNSTYIFYFCFILLISCQHLYHLFEFYSKV